MPSTFALVGKYVLILFPFGVGLKRSKWLSNVSVMYSLVDLSETCNDQRTAPQYTFRAHSSSCTVISDCSSCEIGIEICEDGKLRLGCV